MKMATRMAIHLRWAIASDVPAVVKIDAAASQDESWDQARFMQELRRRECIMIVAANKDDKVMGFVVYELHTDHLKTLKLVVAKKYAGRGVGTALLSKMCSKVPSHRRQYLTLPVTANWKLERVNADRAWLTSDVQFLMGGDTPPPLPILADALEEAECRDEELLKLFRRDGAMANEIYHLVRRQLLGERDAYGNLMNTNY